MKIAAIVKNIINSKISESVVHKHLDRDFCFIHINKTGGTSISKALGLSNKRHWTFREIENEVPRHILDNTFKFSFVRNPFDKVVSHFKYRYKTGQLESQNFNGDFDTWVNQTYGPDEKGRLIHPLKMFLTHSEWMKSWNGEINIDFIGRFESINDDFRKLKDILGTSESLPHLNKTSDVSYRSFYNSPNTKKIISEYFEEDLNRFNYEF